MTLGEGIFSSTLAILFAFFLYQLSVRRAWAKAIKFAAVFALLVLALAGGVSGWQYYQARPHADGKIRGIGLGMSKTDVTLALGEPDHAGSVAGESSDNESKERDVLFYGSLTPRKDYLVIFLDSVGENGRVVSICKAGGFGSIFGARIGSTKSDLIERFGSPTSRTIQGDGLEEALFYEQWNLKFYLQKLQVTQFCLTKGSARPVPDDDSGLPFPEKKEKSYSEMLLGTPG